MNENKKQLLEDNLLEKAAGGESYTEPSPHYFECLYAILDGKKSEAWDIYFEYSHEFSDFDKEELQSLYFEKFHCDIRDDDPPMD